MNTEQLSDALDRCLTLLTEQGATVEECLARYPQHADQLRPLLHTALSIRQLPPVAPRPSSAAAGRRRMLDALAEKERRQSHEANPAAAGLLQRLKDHMADWLSELDGSNWRPAPVIPTALAAAALLLLIVAGTLLLPAWLDPGVIEMARLERPSGVVEVQLRNSDAWAAAVPGQPLEVGMRIRTGADSAVRLAFADGSATVLEADAELAIESLRWRQEGTTTVVLHQPRGRTQHRVVPMPDPKSRFEVHTPLAVTVVRGTEFVVAVQEDGTNYFAVRRGLVEVRALAGPIDPIALRPGWATSVKPSQPPATPFAAPRPLLLEEVPLLEPELAETPGATTTWTPTATPSSVPAETPSPTATLVPRTPTSTPRTIDAAKPTATPMRRTPTPTATYTVEPTTTTDQDTLPTRRPEDTPTPTSTPDADTLPTRRPEDTPTPTSTPDPDTLPTRRPEDTPTPVPTTDADALPTRRPEATATPGSGTGAADDQQGELPPAALPSDQGGVASDDDAAAAAPVAPAENLDDSQEIRQPTVSLQPVGGATLPRGVLVLLAPWMALAALLALLMLGAIVVKLR